MPRKYPGNTRVFPGYRFKAQIPSDQPQIAWIQSIKVPVEVPSLLP